MGGGRACLMPKSLDALAARVAKLPRLLAEDAAERFDDIARAAASRVVGSGAKMNRAGVTLTTAAKVTAGSDGAHAEIVGVPKGPWVWVEGGTRPHRIVTRRFMFGPGMAHPVRVVNHPGMRGQQAWTKAVETFRSDFADQATKTAKGVIRGS